MALKKTELYASLWQSCDELRGGMDASQYKDYVLTLLFMKYVSDKYAGNPHSLLIVPAGGSFADMVRLKGDKEIGDKMNKIIGRLADENSLKGVIDIADFNDEDKLGKGKEMVDRLSKLVSIFDGLDFTANRAEGDDLLGDAYEYLMRHFATESGKSKGQFYTPAEVSRILAKVVGITPETSQDETVYDPTCGSGSLLLKVAAEAPRGLSIYGQEMDNSTAALARMNMILHDTPTADIWQANTLSSPHWREADGSLKRFDRAVANPPFSYKSWSNGVNPTADEFGRFAYGIPPAKNGDYAFLLHILTSLKSTGKAAVILPHGVLFRGNTEADIRRNLIRQGVIKGIIGLPPNLFYGTGIPACIIVLDKSRPVETQDFASPGIFMVDASRGFIKDGNKNRLRARDIHKIVDVFNKQTPLPGYARLVPFSEIAANDYNLNIPRYIDSSEPEDEHDLAAHLHGGIPQRDIEALNSYWRVFPSLRQTLFAPMVETQPLAFPPSNGYATLLVAAGRIKTTLLHHPEFQAFKADTLHRYTAWREAHAPRLYAFGKGDNPQTVIFDLSEDLLARFAEAELIDNYAIYQLLLDYWAETMQDDLYLIAQAGWQAPLRELVATHGERSREIPDLVVGRQKYKADLIPPALLVARYFAAEQAQLVQLQAAQEGLSQELEALLEEHAGEEGLLADATNEQGKVTKAALKKQEVQLLHALKEVQLLPEVELLERDTLAVVRHLLQVMDDEAAAKKAVKEAQERLDKQVLAQYANLSQTEVQTLVIEAKWQATLQTAIEAEIERVTQQLTGRVQLLAERYATPLPQLVDEVAALSSKVAAHLQRMGVAW